MQEIIVGSKPCPICGQESDLNKKGSWLHSILISFDQFGNALANGNPDSTISARVGYFSNAGISESRYPKYWKFLEKMIDFAWWPLELNNHCKEAYEVDPEIHYSGRGIEKIILLILVSVFSLLISTILYFAWLVYPKIRNRYECSKCGKVVVPSTSNEPKEVENLHL